MKRVFASLTVFILMVTLASPVLASEPNLGGRIILEDDAAFTRDEAARKGIVVDPPLEYRSREELRREGARFYGADLPLEQGRERATTTGVLGYVTRSGRTNVYSNRGGTGTLLGYVTFREIVYVSFISVNGMDAYIQFKNANGQLVYGFIDNNAVYTPANGWTRPLNSGRITNYYGLHTGIDVGGHNGANPTLYAVQAGTASFRQTTRRAPNGTLYFADYGKHVRLLFGSYDVIYGHMHSFNGVSSNSYASEGYPSRITSYPKSTVELSSRRVSQGANLGTVGNTGLSDGIHLHFEVRVNGTARDPFTYIVFPNVNWA